MRKSAKIAAQVSKNRCACLCFISKMLTMSIKYRVIQKVDPRDTEGPRKYYGVIRRDQLITEAVLATQIALMCTVKAPDVRGVLTAMQEEIISNLQAGNSIHLDNLGILRNVLECITTEDPNEWNVGFIKNVRTQFIQRDAVRLKLGDPEVKLEKAMYLPSPT